MWICAKCGTQAQQPDMCSGCGSKMVPLLGPARVGVTFVLVLDEGRDAESSCNDFIIGPFISVTEADQWWEQHRTEDRFSRVKHYETSIMEGPYSGQQAGLVG